MAGPGERVLVREGIYREEVRPQLGGAGPDAMVAYEAEPGRPVVIRGSCILPSRWQRRANHWVLSLPEEPFAAYNPFGLVNLDKSDPDNWQSANPEPRCPADVLSRGLLFQDGSRLRQVAAVDELRPGTFCVAGEGWELNLHPLNDTDPNRVLMEATNRKQSFAPIAEGVSFVRLHGLTFEQVANGFSYPVEAAVASTGGDHWIVEDCTVRHVNADGIGIGDHMWTWGGKLDGTAGRHCIVRRNRIYDCGVSGIKGITPWGCLIEDNFLEQIGWQRVEHGYDNGGMKLLVCRDLLVRRNYLRGMIEGPGIWLDWDNVNCRVTRNAVLDSEYAGGAIFVEASDKTNWVDNNAIWNIAGPGVYLQDCDAVDIFDNVIGNCKGAAVDARVVTQRLLHGRRVTSRRNRARGNLLIDNGAGISFQDPDNTAEANVELSGQTVDLAPGQH